MVEISTTRTNYVKFVKLLFWSLYFLEVKFSLFAKFWTPLRKEKSLIMLLGLPLSLWKCKRRQMRTLEMRSSILVLPAGSPAFSSELERICCEEITILIPTMQMMKFKLRRLKLRRNHRLQKSKRIVQHLPCSTKYQTARQDYSQFFLVLIIRYIMI